jgi:hypothetical protein
MRSQIWLLAASAHLASADWALGQALDYRGGEAALMLPRQTGASAHDSANGWTPRPTDGPSLELARRMQDRMRFRRQGGTSNTWLNDETCGWAAGTSGEFVMAMFPPSLSDTAANQHSWGSRSIHLSAIVHLRNEHGPSRRLHVLWRNESLLHSMPGLPSCPGGGVREYRSQDRVLVSDDLQLPKPPVR